MTKDSVVAAAATAILAAIALAAIALALAAVLALAAFLAVATRNISCDRCKVNAAFTAGVSAVGVGASAVAVV